MEDDESSGYWGAEGSLATARVHSGRSPDNQNSLQ